MRANFDLLGLGDGSGEEEWCSRSEEKQGRKNGQVAYLLPAPADDGTKPDFLRQVSKTITRSQGLHSLRRSRLIHLFYIVALPLFTVLGALVFKALDGDYDDQALIDYDNRCTLQRSVALNLSRLCSSTDTQSDCLPRLQSAIMQLDSCFRNRSYTNFPTHSMSHFANSLIFAASVYTTIGYGNIAPDTFACRLATCIYAIVGIPLFFAFLKDMGQLFSQLFIRGWRLAGRLRRRWKRHRHRDQNATLRSLAAKSVLPAHITVNMHKVLSHSFSGTSNKVREQRKVFLWAVVFFIIYLAGCSWVFWWMEPEWDLWTSFYFLFTSVALVGFGDVFPRRPSVVLINFAFIVLGIVLFGMCYFILQEEIREKAFQASRRVRNSIFRRGPVGWGHPQRKRSMSVDARRPKSLLRLPARFQRPTRSSEDVRPPTSNSNNTPPPPSSSPPSPSPSPSPSPAPSSTSSSRQRVRHGRVAKDSRRLSAPNTHALRQHLSQWSTVV